MFHPLRILLCTPQNPVRECIGRRVAQNTVKAKDLKVPTVDDHDFNDDGDDVDDAGVAAPKWEPSFYEWASVACCCWRHHIAAVKFEKSVHETLNEMSFHIHNWQKGQHMMGGATKRGLRTLLLEALFFGKLAWQGCRTVVTSSRESKCSNMPPSTEQQRPARWSLIWGWWLLFSAVVKNVTCNGSPSQLCVLKYRKNVNTQRIRFCENKIRKWNYQLGTTLVLPIQHSPPSRRRSSRTCKDGLE